MQDLHGIILSGNDGDWGQQIPLTFEGADSFPFPTSRYLEKGLRRIATQKSTIRHAVT